MNFSETDIALFIQQYFWPFLRIGGLFLAMPVIGTRIVPVRAKVLLALVVTILIVPVLPPVTTVNPLSLGAVATIIKELLVGVAVGFSLQVAFQIFVLAGQFIAMKMGLGFASMNDPANGVQTTVISQFYLMTVTLMFVAVNGHLILLELIVSSFETIPPGSVTFLELNLYSIVELGSWLFATALVFSLPLLTSILVINIAFGIMSRAAPQLNIFAVGFPFTLACGMALIWLGMGSLSQAFDNVMSEAFIYVKYFIEGP